MEISKHKLHPSQAVVRVAMAVTCSVQLQHLHPSSTNSARASADHSDCITDPSPTEVHTSLHWASTEAFSLQHGDGRLNYWALSQSSVTYSPSNYELSISPLNNSSNTNTKRTIQETKRLCCLQNQVNQTNVFANYNKGGNGMRKANAGTKIHRSQRRAIICWIQD